MTAELQVAQDISAEIEAAELEYAAQLVYDRAGGKPIAQVSSYGACSFPAGQSLTISFDWHENTTARKARYSAEFERKTAAEQWVLSEISITGEQTRPGQDEPIHFNGYLERETLEQVTAYAADIWARCTAHAFAIGGVTTNRLPPIHYGTGSSESDNADFVYVVSVRDLSPQPLSLQAPESNALAVGSISSSDHTYSLRMTDIGSGRVRTNQADCVGENCDPKLLACLRANLDQPSDSTEAEKGLQDARAVLPPTLRGAQVRSTQKLMLGTTEMFFVVFAETPVSGSRKESVSVTCYRPTGTHDDWSCSYSIGRIEQRVPDQTREVHLLGSTFSESEVKQIVTELRRQLAAHPDLAATTAGIELFSINTSEEKLTCLFLCDRELWKAVFSYRDEVRLEALEFLQGLPEDPGRPDPDRGT